MFKKRKIIFEDKKRKFSFFEDTKIILHIKYTKFYDHNIIDATNRINYYPFLFF